MKRRKARERDGKGKGMEEDEDFETIIDLLVTFIYSCVHSFLLVFIYIVAMFKNRRDISREYLRASS